MTHPNQASIDAFMSALLLDHLEPHLAAPAAFARQMAEYIGQSEAHAPDPDQVDAGTRLFLALRLAWNANPRATAASGETMAAIQDALRALDYHLGLDDLGFDMHTPAGDGGMDALDPMARDHLESSGFREDADLGLIDAALWHALAHHIVGNAFEEDDPVQLVNIHRTLRLAMITRIYTGSYDRDGDGLDKMIEEARGLVTDMARVPTSDALIAISLAMRESFGVVDGAEAHDARRLTDSPLPEGLELSMEAMQHASGTLAAISEGTKEMAWATIITMMIGSRTGMPVIANLDAVYQLVRNTDDILATDDEDSRRDLLDAVASICAAMTLAGRLEPLDRERNSILINLAAELVSRDIDPFEDDVSAIIECVVQALQDFHPALDEYLEHAAAAEADEDAITVRRGMSSADPSPPPADGHSVVPTAVLIETDGDIDIFALKHRVEAFFHAQPDSFRAFEQGDIYWRLMLDGQNTYSGTLGALKTISALQGIAKASVVHRGPGGLGVTTIVKGGRPVHRLVNQN